MFSFVGQLVEGDGGGPSRPPRALRPGGGVPGRSRGGVPAGDHPPPCVIKKKTGECSRAQTRAGDLATEARRDTRDECEREVSR